MPNSSEHELENHESPKTTDPVFNLMQSPIATNIITALVIAGMTWVGSSFYFSLMDNKDQKLSMSNFQTEITKLNAEVAKLNTTSELNQRETLLKLAEMNRETVNQNRSFDAVIANLDKRITLLEDRARAKPSP